MKIARLVICALTLSFAALLLSAVVTRGVSANLNCAQLRSCSGDAGCGSGSVEDCTITCTSGIHIFCNP